MKKERKRREGRRSEKVNWLELRSSSDEFVKQKMERKKSQNIIVFVLFVILVKKRDRYEASNNT